ncbi:MAG TPA: hypothetical protein VGK89_07825 [Candidatus Eisenbacteria bacterium]|jgi:hypothetical protein
MSEVRAATLAPRRRRHFRCAAALALGILLAGLHAPAPVRAQIDVLKPVLDRLNGGAVWGGVGVRGTRAPGNVEDRRPIWRGGFGIFYGPFGGRGDTTVSFARTYTDSMDTTLCDPSQTPPRRLHRRVKDTRVLASQSKLPGGGGKVTFLVGYQYSSFYRLHTAPLPATVPMSGVFAAAMLGPYRPVPRWSKLEWYAAGGGTVVQLRDIAGRIDTLAVQATTERTLAPELFLMLSYAVVPGYRLLVSGSYQYVRFGSVAFRSVETGRLIPGPVVRTLPQDLELQAWHLTVGLSFTASSLVPGR